MEYSNIRVKVFGSCDTKNKPTYSSQNIQVIKGTEVLVTKEFEEIANMRGSTCTSCCSESDGENFGFIAIDTIDKRFTIPSDAEKVIIDFFEIKSYISKKFSLLNPRYTNNLGTLSFIIDDTQYPDIDLKYEKMILDIPKAYRNSSRLAYIYLEDCKAGISFLRKKNS